MTRLPNGAWSGGRGSNPRPSDWKSDALPAELPPHIAPPLDMHQGAANPYEKILRGERSLTGG